MGTFQFLQQRTDERETIYNWTDTATTMQNLNLVTVVGEMGFIVNTTSLGLSNTENTMVDFTQVNPQAFVYDLIYNPKLTKFLSAAKERNLGYQNGMKMLIEQAAESFKIWHNIQPKISDELMNVLEEL